MENKILKLLSLILLIKYNYMFSWQGIVIPISFNKSTNQFNILLVRLNAPTGQGIWSYFAQNAIKGEKGNQVAMRALKNQTNGLYDISLQGVPWKKVNNDIIHVTKVNFISGKDLYLGNQQSTKNDFKWVPVDNILNGQLNTLSQKNKSPEPIDSNLIKFLKNYWKEIEQQLNSEANTSTSASTSSSQKEKIVLQEIKDKLDKKEKINWLEIKDAILFYEKNKPYYEFTNFQEGYPIFLDGKNWPTTEHYYQAQKFSDTNIQEQIRNAKTAREVFDIGNNPAYKQFKRSNWNQISLKTMENAVRAKFNQHNKLKNILISTNDKILVENAGKNDTFYGAGADGYGENHLGRILMKIREELTEPSKPQAGKKIDIRSLNDSLDLLNSGLISLKNQLK